MFPTSSTCLLCGCFLQPDDKDAFITHLSVQHKVICNMDIIMVASQLVGEEVNQVMEFIKSFGEKREALGEDNDLDPGFVINCKEENFPLLQDMHSFVGHIIDSDEYKTELHQQVVKKECEEEVKPLKKRGIKKGSSIIGCVDKKTLPQTLLLGPCQCPLCKKQFSVIDLETEKLYRRHLYVHRVKKFDCQCVKTWASDKDLKLHIYKYHRGSYHCDTCRQTFDTEDKYEEHIAADPHKEEAFVCDDCGFISQNKPTDKKTYKDYA